MYTLIAKMMNSMKTRGIAKEYDRCGRMLSFISPYSPHRNDEANSIADDCMNLGAIMNVESVSQWRGDCCPSTIM